MAGPSSKILKNIKYVENGVLLNQKILKRVLNIIMKRRTKAQKCKDYYDVFKCIREDRKVKREGTKDGSIATHPVVEVHRVYSERYVLRSCITWLRSHDILCNRNNVGAGEMGASGYYSYGIRGAGDIIGLLKTGQHFEIECKRGAGGRLSLEQQKRMRQIRENNGLYFMVHGVEELEHYFKELV